MLLIQKVVIITTFVSSAFLGRPMEKAISAAEANRKFSQLLREVREGQSYVVTSHGRPVARIEPIETQNRSRAKAVLLARIAKQPVQDVGRWTRDELYDD